MNKLLSPEHELDSQLGQSITIAIFKALIPTSQIFLHSRRPTSCLACPLRLSIGCHNMQSLLAFANQQSLYIEKNRLPFQSIGTNMLYT